MILAYYGFIAALGLVTLRHLTIDCPDCCGDPDGCVWCEHTGIDPGVDDDAPGDLEEGAS